MEVAGQAFAVLLVFALLGLAVWRFGRGGLPTNFRPSLRGGRHLDAVERIVLTPQHAVHLVRFEGRDLIVATHPQGCSLLLERKPEA